MGIWYLRYQIIPEGAAARPERTPFGWEGHSTWQASWWSLLASRMGVRSNPTSEGSGTGEEALKIDQADREILAAYIPQVILPKKGKLSQKEKALESAPAFKKLKNKHNAVESNINELEHRGLNRCPDRSEYAFKRYIGLAVSAYNLHKIGRKLQADQLAEEKRQAEALQQAA